MRALTEAELVAEGERIGAALPPGAVVRFEGDLGAGKTTLVKAIARGLGVTEAPTSPTYALVHHYHGRRGAVYHLDCYRLRSPDEAADLDWEGLLRDGDVLLVEWPERAGAWVPPATHRVRLHHLDDAERRGLEVSVVDATAADAPASEVAH
ncbi:MAG TPA: tRNA (adenosine(37)-N6)-threonylcarbamoyltransferase complex ATPase subunit type 1 TsaE [Gemmatimonadales bacterium]|nr:tRNA (adenosine(37)-N6)-threonylcarbamoyltransferase complex ATPase subunit type 1 TsaE [Gemmatimonadales bacterium]